MTDDAKNEIEQLKKELAEVKAAVAPTPYDPKAAAEWADQMHQMRERRASNYGGFSRADLEAFEAAAPTSVVKGIALRDARAPSGPSSAGALSGQVTKVSTAPGIPGSGTGWVNSAPLGPPPGIRYVDQQVNAQDERDLHERLMQEALMKTGEK